MHRRSQFDIRENPASDRRHGSRLAINDTANKNYVTDDTAAVPSSTPVPDQLPVDTHTVHNAATPCAATGGEKLSDPTHPSVASRPFSSVAVPRDFEPLIGSCEAARLLGNIHVKTLQRYARHLNIPGYQIGGHWYFRASELDSWLRSRLNSSCHPCRLQEESDGT